MSEEARRHYEEAIRCRAIVWLIDHEPEAEKKLPFNLKIKWRKLKQKNFGIDYEVVVNDFAPQIYKYVTNNIDWVKYGYRHENLDPQEIEHWINEFMSLYGHNVLYNVLSSNY